ncbi:YraN family protein [Candidatus Parcubacteria bacterium]|nr:YraN family protein [Candidatus Parcubacteria bacterium]
MINRKQLGELGEKIARDYLESKDFDILARNWIQKTRTGRKFGEIDIIAGKDDVIRFVEVKTLSSGKGIAPEQRVDFRKQRKLQKLAQIWLTQNKFSLDTPWQIDIISIKIDLETQKPEILHFENAVEEF